jgi:hypothetical protein
MNAGSKRGTHRIDKAWLEWRLMAIFWSWWAQHAEAEEIALGFHASHRKSACMMPAESVG